MFRRSFAASILIFAVCLANSLGAAEPASPNILFAIADDWSFGHAGAYGCKWVETPAFDRIAREGLLFEHAYTPNAKCAPSRAILLTGRNSWELEEAANHICFFPSKFTSFMEVLGKHGYSVGCTAKGWGPGVANDADGKPRQMTGKPYNARKATPPASGINNNDYAANFDDFLAEVPEDKPWCFWYGATEPHRGYENGAGVKKGGKSLDMIDRVPAYWPDNDSTRNDMLDYGFEVEHYDRHLGRMLKSLEERGQLDNTLVVATSDHGMPFPRVKGQAYEASNHIPLAIMWPKGIENPGRIVTDFVAFNDVAPTFLEVAGVAWETSGMQPTSGRSWSSIFKSGKSGRTHSDWDRVLIGKERHDIGRPHDGGYPIRGIMTESWLYLRNYEPDRWPAGNPETGYLNTDAGPIKTQILELRRNGTAKTYWEKCFGRRPAEELFDLSRDLDCVNNLAKTSEFRNEKERLSSRMIRELRSQQDPRMFGNGDVFDKYLYSNEGTRNFYERFMNGEQIRAGWVSPSDFEEQPIE
ncbi:MAG TPA: sulfatase [Planctomycetaceae bacterium]|nr:sulfatase [Planctomycetaceae bacterium]